MNTFRIALYISRNPGVVVAALSLPWMIAEREGNRWRRICSYRYDDLRERNILDLEDGMCMCVCVCDPTGPILPELRNIISLRDSTQFLWQHLESFLPWTRDRRHRLLNSFCVFSRPFVTRGSAASDISFRWLCVQLSLTSRLYIFCPRCLYISLYHLYMCIYSCTHSPY